MSDCETNPMKRHWMASPAAVVRVKIVIAKIFFLVCASAINVSAPPARRPARKWHAGGTQAVCKGYASGTQACNA